MWLLVYVTTCEISNVLASLYLHQNRIAKLWHPVLSCSTGLATSVCRWDASQKICVDAQLLAFAVARPVDGTPQGYIYKYAATKATDIGKSRWLLQVSKAGTVNKGCS